jgi:hypothetical protein
MPVSFETYDKLYDRDIEFGECAEKGRAIVAYIDQYNSETAMASMRKITFQAPDGSLHFDIPVVNASHWGNSHLLNSIADGHPFVLSYFRRNDGKYQYSARVSSESGFDVSKLAKSFGGGGHVKASGFTLDREIEELPPPGAGASNPDLLSLEEPDSD